MKKKLPLIFAAAFLILLILSPLLIGLWLKSNNTRLFSSALIDRYGKMTLLSYHQGYFSSTAQYKLTITPTIINQETPAPINILFNLTIKHGPIIINQKHTWQIALSYITFKSMNPMWPISGTSTIGGLTPSYGSIQAPFLDIKTKQQKTTLSNLVGTWQNNQGTIQGKVMVKSIHTAPIDSNSAANNETTINNLQYDFNYRMDQNTWLGYHNINIGQITSNKAQGISHVNQLMFDLKQEKNNNQLNIILNIHTGIFSTKTLPSSGPFTMKISLNGLNFNYLNQIYRIAQNNPNNPVINNDIMMLIRQGVAIKLSQLSLKTPQGPFNMDGFLSLPNIADKSLTPSTILNALKGGLNIKIAKSLLQHTALKTSVKKTTSSTNKITTKQHVKNLINNKHLILKGNRYVMHITYENRVFKVNGIKTNPLDLFLPNQKLNTQTTPASKAQKSKQSLTPSTNTQNTLNKTPTHVKKQTTH